MSTLQVSELRIGNVVRFYANNKPLVINDINSENKNAWIKGYVTQSNGDKTAIQCLEPVILTEEWHNKFGVKKNGFKSFEYKLPRKLNIDITIIFNGDYVMLRQGEKNLDDDIISIWNKDLTKRDMYVHEWQNLYFCLCGEELTIQ